MAITALDTARVMTHVFSKDDPADPTVFHLATLTSRDIARIRDGVTSFEFASTKDKEKGKDEEAGSTKTSIQKSKLTFEACRRGLVGWENYLGADGTPIKFETIQREIDKVQRRVVKPELLDHIPLEVLEELADVILGEAEASGEELGNSPVPPSDGSSTPEEAA